MTIDSSVTRVIEDDFLQWKRSISNTSRLPGGLTSTMREKLWITLAKNYIDQIHLDWTKTCQYVFNDESLPNDDRYLHQITKDLHRTGCHYSSSDLTRTSLQRVLLGFARYHKSIGYCQGLHILASVILDVVQMNEDAALMILIYLIDHCLPDYFSNHLNALPIDMAVFDQCLEMSHPQLHKHLQKLRLDASTDEPPLVNVFTIQWFLTLYTTCLSRSTTLRIWDALMLDGNEILFRTSLVLWTKFSFAVMKVSTADQFYSAMTHLLAQLLNEKILSADQLIDDIYNLGPLPMVILSELREKFSSPSKSKDLKELKTKSIDEDLMNVVSCFSVLSSRYEKSFRQDDLSFKQRNQQIQIHHPSTSNSFQLCGSTPSINHLLVRSNNHKPNVSILVEKTKKKKVPVTEDPLISRLIHSTPKYSSFNPFPSRSVNENVAINGCKLGLYAPMLR